MGVAIWQLIPRKTVDPEDLEGRIIALDAFNTIYYFLSVIRHRVSGEPLKDHAGRVTSHLSGLLYRTVSLLELGIRPVYVFNGHYPHFKKETVRRRRTKRKQAEQKWKEAVRRGKPALKYAQQAVRIDAEIVQSSKELLDLMGVPWIQAPSEGEAQCAWMCQQRMVYAAASQDLDTLLFGSPRLVRNLSAIARTNAKGGEEVYAELDPELIELEGVLDALQLTREQLVLVGMLIGTDYNAGVQNVGPMTALRLVKTHKTLSNILATCRFPGHPDVRQVYEFFLNPPHTNECRIAWSPPDINRLNSFLVRQHAFSEARVQTAAQRLQASFDQARERHGTSVADV
jgi:flap endonuclease-1